MSSFSDSDGHSERFSLFSHPMTRASSAATEYSDVAVIPLEKVSASSTLEMNGPCKMAPTPTRMHTSSRNSQYRLDPVLEAVELESDRRESYFPNPHIGTPLKQDKSTKDLIKQYESLERNSTMSQASKMKSSRKKDFLATKQDSATISKDKHIANKLANRSPIRRSFSNLLAIFGRKSKTLAKDGDNLPSLLLRPNTSQPVKKGKTTVDPPAASPLYSGLLLYLSPPPTSNGVCLPIWIDCITTLYPTHIHITWRTSQGNPHPHSRAIQLGPCIDVHSVTLGELDSDEIALLPTRELKVFELLFKERPKEKFVAASVQERAGWISAIWDAILGIQQHKKAVCYDDSETPRYTPAHARFPSSEFSFVSQGSNAVERDLPPIPSPLPVPTSDLRSLPTLDPKISLVSCNSVSSSPRSASILDLSKRSVVSQRLDQIERTRITAVPGRGLQTNARTLGSTLERQSSACSTGAESLLDLYEENSTARALPLNSRLTRTSPPLPLIPEISSDIAEQNTNKDPGSPLSTYTAANKGVRLDGLVELLQDQATKHYYHTNELGDQIASIHSEIRGTFAELKTAVGEQLSLNAERLVESLMKSMASLEQRLREMRNSEEVVTDVGEKLEGIHAEIRSFAECEKTGLEDMKQAILKNMDELVKGAAVSQTTNHDPELISATTGQIFAEAVLGDLRPSTETGGEGSALVNLSELNAKLDSLLEQRKGMSIGMKIAEPSELKDILTLLEEDRREKVTQVEHQKDSARYLNELNAWLETFVKDGVSKIETIASAVGQIHSELVPATGESNEDEAARPTGGLLASIRLLLAESKERDQSLAVLHAAVNSLFAAVTDKLSAGGNLLTTEVVAGMLNQQHQEQERVLRTIAADLSNDIKGERLRFVEAMKEATAINVQVHVNEFKKQLTKEVFMMTQEVGRLQKERQALEQQIGDLFTFYAKQKDLTAGMMIAPQPGAKGSKN